MVRGGGKRRSRHTPRRRGSPGWLIATLALPVLGLIAFVGWKGWPQLGTHPSTAAESGLAAPAPSHSRSIDWPSALASAGLESTRLTRDGHGFELETTQKPSEVASQLQDRLTASVSTNGDTIQIHPEEGPATFVRIRPLPTSDSGLGLFEAEARTDPGGGGKIVLILDDAGFRTDSVARAARLDRNIAFAVIPNAAEAGRSTALLAESGHEVLCHLPMEPEGWPTVRVDDPAIFTSMSDDEIRRVTSGALDALPGVRGLNNHMGSRASTDSRLMSNVMQVLKERGLYFVDSRTSSRSVGADAARAAGVPSTRREVFLDDDRSPVAVRAQLARLESLARSNGVAVGIGHLHPATLEILERELPAMRARGIEVVRPSTVVD